MKFLIQLALFVVWQASSFAQTSLLEKYNFEEGGYYLVGLQTMKVARNAFAKATKEFYIDDIKTLQAIKKEWVYTDFNLEIPYGCHYEIWVCKNGVGLESFCINLNCNLICTENIDLYFSATQLTKFKHSFKKLKSPSLPPDLLKFLHKQGRKVKR